MPVTVRLEGPVFTTPVASIARECETTLRLAQDLVVAEVALLQPVGVTGELRRRTQPGPIMRTAVGWTGPVVCPLVYAEVMDLGRRPGARMPPLAPIMLWVERVLRVGLTPSGRRSRRRGAQAEVRSVAFLIARAIGRRGIRGRQFFSRGLDTARPKLAALEARLRERVAALLA